MLVGILGVRVEKRRGASGCSCTQACTSYNYEYYLVCVLSYWGLRIYFWDDANAPLTLTLTRA